MAAAVANDVSDFKEFFGECLNSERISQILFALQVVALELALRGVQGEMESTHLSLVRAMYPRFELAKSEALERSSHWRVRATPEELP